MQTTDEPTTDEQQNITDMQSIDEPTTDEEVSNQPITESQPSDDISKSLTTVVDYFATMVADKVATSISSDKPQNGFSSVKKAAETMANTGGSKFKKTRRLKLTNKNNTRNNK
jgi:hypothetical protein